MQRKHTFVTVAHEVDYALLKLQARSMSLYLPREMVETIIVVENFTPGVTPNWDAGGLLEAYGYLADKVVFIPGSSLVDMPAGASGWWTQQVLKLLVAFHVPTARYIVLDAKNHLAFTLGQDFLTDSAGRARMRAYGYGDHPLRPRLETCLRYLELAEEANVAHFPQTSTPFTIYCEQAIELICHVTHKGCRDEDGDDAAKVFAKAFLDQELTEFFLYSGWIKKTGQEDALYAFDQPDSPIIWPHQTEPLELLKTIGRTEAHRPPFFAIHRGAVQRLDAIGVQIITQFWVRRKLFDDIAAAETFLLEEIGF